MRENRLVFNGRLYDVNICLKYEIGVYKVNPMKIIQVQRYDYTAYYIFNYNGIRQIFSR